MADNYVQISVRASDQAKPDLDELKAKLQELGREVETAKVDVDDRDAEVTLLRMNAKLAALNSKVSNPKISLAGAARAEAEIAAVNLQLDHLKEKADSSGATGLLGRILTGATTPLSSGGGLGPLPAFLSSPVALAGVAGAITALLPELVTLVSGFAAAGAGAVSFGALAMPAVKSVETAYTSLNAAQQKYDQAVALNKMDPTKAHAAAVKAALDQVNLVGQAVQKLPGQEQGALDGIYKLTRTYQQMAAAFAPDAFKVFNDGLKVANNLLPAVTPFATAFADALDGLLQKAAGFTESKGFQEWLGQFQQLAGPATTAIGVGIGHLVTSFGKLLTIFSAKDVVNGINIAFSVLDGILIGLVRTVEFLKSAWDKLSNAFVQSRHEVANVFDGMRHDVADFAHNVAAHFDEIRRGIARTFTQAGHDIVSGLDQARHAIASWGDDIVNWFKQLPGRLKTIIGQIFDPSTFSSAISSSKPAIEHAFASIFDDVRHAVSSAFDGMRHDVAASLDQMRHDAASKFDQIRHAIAATADQIPHDAATAFDSVRHQIATHLDQVRTDITNWGSNVLTWFEQLPAQIVTAIGDLSHTLEPAGHAIIDGLISGLGNSLPNLARVLGGVATFIAEHKGPIEKDRLLLVPHGQAIMDGLMGGMNSRIPSLRSELNSITGVIAGTGISARGPGGAGTAGQGVVHLQVTGGGAGLDGLFAAWLKNYVRASGGDPSMFNRKVAFS